MSVHVPIAPNPLSGWGLFVPRRKVFPVGLTAEQALGITLSGGLVVGLPGSRRRNTRATLPQTWPERALDAAPWVRYKCGG